MDSLIIAGNGATSISTMQKVEKAISYDVGQSEMRCKAITKKGTQCKRMAKKDGYCWQHMK
jgi:hypothetical protein